MTPFQFQSEAFLCFTNAAIVDLLARTVCPPKGVPKRLGHPILRSYLAESIHCAGPTRCFVTGLVIPFATRACAAAVRSPHDQGGHRSRLSAPLTRFDIALSTGADWAQAGRSVPPIATWIARFGVPAFVAGFREILAGHGCVRFRHVRQARAAR